MVSQLPQVHLYERTLREVYEALEKNGFELTRDLWYNFQDQVVTGACVLGQTALNLHVVGDGGEECKSEENETARSYAETPSRMWEDYDKGELTIWARDEGVIEAARNSDQPLTLYNQLNQFNNEVKMWRHKNLETEAVGETIVSWNDASMEAVRGFGEGYFLRTYEAVAQMAKDVLEPYFDEKIYLIQLNLPVKPLVAVGV